MASAIGPINSPRFAYKEKDGDKMLQSRRYFYVDEKPVTNEEFNRLYANAFDKRVIRLSNDDY